MFTRPMIAIVWACALSNAARADDWPTFQQNYQRNAKSEDRLSRELSLAWSWSSHGVPQPAWSGPAKWDAYAGIRGLKSMRNYDPVFHPIAVGDRVWFGSSVDDAVHCLDLETGKERWTFVTDGPVRLPPTYADNRLYFGSDDGFVYCISADLGELIWKFRPQASPRQIINNGRSISIWPVRTGVIVLDGHAFFGASLLPWRDSYLCSVNADTGEARGDGTYVRKLENATFEGPLSVVPGKYLVAPQGRVAPRLFQISDGAPLGSLKGGGGSFVVLTKDSVFHGPGNKTGWLTVSSLESLETVASFRNANAMVAAGDVSFILTDDALSSSNYVTRQPRWSAECDHPLSMLLAGDVIITGGQGSVAAFSADHGEPIWSKKVDGKAYGLAVASNRLLVSTDSGQILAFQAGIPDGQPAESSSEEMPDQDQVAREPARTIAPSDDPSILAQWAVQRSAVDVDRLNDLAGKLDLKLPPGFKLERAGHYESLVMSTQAESLKAVQPVTADDLPRESFSAEAWVRVDTPTRWGGIVGCIQDNGDFERGWLLGFEENHFCLAVASEAGSGRLTYLKAEREFNPTHWYHVVGTYDGNTMRIYLNGELSGSSPKERGAIHYAGQRRFVVGAYEDDNERYPLVGRLHEVRLYRRTLSEEEIHAHYVGRQDHYPEGAEVPDREGDRLATSPRLDFPSRRSARIRWQSETEVPTQLALRRQGELVNTFVDQVPKLQHEVVVDGLDHNTLYTYQIQWADDGVSRASNEYECDTFFNFAVPDANLGVRSDVANVVARRAQLVLAASGRKRGICVCVGCHQDVIQSLLAGSEMRLIVFGTDVAQVQELRDWLSDSQAYGVRVTVHHVDSLDQLPFTTRAANLIVADQDPLSDKAVEQLQRLLAPQGEAWLSLSKDTSGQRPSDLGGELVRNELGTWLRLTGSQIDGAGDWNHIYGNAANNHFGGESLAKVRTTDELVVQWIGRPGPRYQADRNGRKPAPLATNGRVFLQGLHRLIALDQYNGTVLWSLEIPEIDRYNMPRDCGNWCADENSVYLVVQNQCWHLAADDGRLLQVIDLPATSGDGQASDWGFVARDQDLLIGSRVKQGASWSSFWGKDAWYDGAEGPVTAKICSEQLFAMDAESGQVKWQRQVGAVVNSTISIDEGMVCFVESRAKMDNANGRFAGEAFWSEQYLVALDLQNGRPRWERPLNTKHGTVAFYGAMGESKFVIVSSTDRQYFIYVINASNGKDLWQANIPWGKGKADHGSHLSRPAIVGSRLYVRPAAFELSSGKKLSLQLPVGGCGSYAATENAMFFRARVWQEFRGVGPKGWQVYDVEPLATRLLVEYDSGGGNASFARGRRWMQLWILVGNIHWFYTQTHCDSVIARLRERR